MKKAFGTILMGLAAVSVLGVSGTALADGTTSTDSSTAVTNPTAQDTTDNDQSTAKTTGTLNFKGGTLSLYNVQDSAAFNTTNTAFSTQDVFLNGLKPVTADTKMTATVDEFLGGENDAWTLKVTKSDWKAGQNGVASGATALDSGAHLSLAKGEIESTGVTFGQGTGEGHNVLTAQDLNLSIEPGTSVKKGAYTNTLNWSLAQDPASDQN